MSPNLRIAFRFLTAKKRSMMMSLACTILGVGLFIVTQATTSGFENYFIKTMIASDGALRIVDQIQDTMRSMGVSGGAGIQVRARVGVKYIEGINEPRRIIEAVNGFAGVLGVSAVLKGDVQVSSSFKIERAQVFGIDLAQHLRVSQLAQKIVAGRLEDFGKSPSAALVGRVLADRLQLTVGDSFVIKAYGEARHYRVVALFETGLRDIDKTRLYVDLVEARSLLKKPTGATFIQMNIDDPNRAEALAARMAEMLHHNVEPWQLRQVEWLQTFRALRISSAITVTVFTLIAGLAMFNTLAMIVIEKTKDIAILRSMGFERRDITQIFLWQAAIVLAFGAVGGALFGAAVTSAVEHLPLTISTLFKTDHFLVEWNPWHYVEAIGTAVVMVMIASLVPARRAARLEPGDIVRGTAQ